MSTNEMPPTAHPTRMLKIVLAIMCVILLLVAPGVIAFVIARGAPENSSAAEVLPVLFASMLLTLTPAIAGYLASSLPSDFQTEVGRRHFRVLARVSASVVLVCAAILIVSAQLGAAPSSIAWTLAAGSAVLTTVCLRVGKMIWTRNGLRPQRPWTLDGVDRAATRKKWARVTITFLVTLFAGASLLPLLGGGAEDPGRFAAAVTLLAVGIALLAAAVACLIFGLPLTHRITQLFGGDVALQKLVRQVVLKTNFTPPTPLDSSTQVTAAQFATLMSAFLPFQTAQNTLFLVSTVFIQVPGLLNPDGELRIFNVLLTAFVVIALCAIGPFLVRQIRRVRRYRDAHLHLLNSPTA